jgi:hypothetical protein
LWVRADRPTSGTDRSAHERFFDHPSLDRQSRHCTRSFRQWCREGAVSCRLDSLVLEYEPVRRTRCIPKTAKPIQGRVEIMVNTIFTSSWVIGGWIAAVVIITVASVAMGANPSTTALLVALGVAPGVVAALLRYGAPPPTVAQILHSVETKDGRTRTRTP